MTRVMLALLVVRASTDALDDKFEKYAAEARNLKQRPTDDELLKLYGLYKQATMGDDTDSEPWAFQFKARSKWNAWTANAGMSKEEAETKYIDLVKKYIKEYGLKTAYIGMENVFLGAAPARAPGPKAEVMNPYMTIM